MLLLSSRVSKMVTGCIKVFQKIKCNWTLKTLPFNTKLQLLRPVSWLPMVIMFSCYDIDDRFLFLVQNIFCYDARISCVNLHISSFRKGQNPYKTITILIRQPLSQPASRIVILPPHLIENVDRNGPPPSLSLDDYEYHISCHMCRLIPIATKGDHCPYPTSTHP